MKPQSRDVLWGVLAVTVGGALVWATVLGLVVLGTVVARAAWQMASGLLGGG